MNAPRTDVVVYVASINTAAATELCIRSMRQKAGIPFELVVGDGGSTDGSLEMLRTLEARGWLRLEVAAEGRKHAEWLDRWVGECPARFAVFSDSDVEYLGDGWLDDMVGAARDQDAALVSCRILETDRPYRHPHTGAIRTLAPRPAPWLMLLDLERLRGTVDAGFGYVDVEDPAAFGGKVAYDTGGAFFAALRDAGLRWVELPAPFRRKYRHYGGLSWRSARDSRASIAARVRQVGKIVWVLARLLRARALRYGEVSSASSPPARRPL